MGEAQSYIPAALYSCGNGMGNGAAFIPPKAL